MYCDETTVFKIRLYKAKRPFEPRKSNYLFVTIVDFHEAKCTKSTLHGFQGGLRIQTILLFSRNCEISP